MRPRKTERDRIVALLDAEHPDVDALAGAVFDTVAGMLLQREWWVLHAGVPGQWSTVFGPWATRNQAVKSVGVLELRGEDVLVQVRRLATVGGFDEDS